jgi:mono/diheme cytochrome c family protein
MHLKKTYHGARRRVSNAILTGLLSLSATVVMAQSQPDAGLIERGRYLATAADCIACHGSKPGAEFAGGLALATPLGQIYATNITPSKQHGIGNYSEQDFERAVRKGIRADGAHLYPAMPYTSYAGITDADMQALYAYFMQGVKAVDQAPAQQTALPFPFNIRLSMWAWNLLFLDSKPFSANPQDSEALNRGRYLATALAHCATCHTPRNLLMAEQSSAELQGSSLGTWFAPNITNDMQAGIGNWSQAEIVSYLKTGRVEGKAQAAGPMAEAIDHSLQHLNDGDLNAIASWLRTVKGASATGQTAKVEAKPAATAALSYEEQVRGAPLPDDRKLWSGAQLYDAYCASCHQANGGGSRGLPSLSGNRALQHGNADNLIMVMLDGIERLPEVPGAAMPAFSTLLSDDEIARIGSFVMQQYGPAASTVSSDRVTALRAGGSPSPLKMLSYAIPVGGLLLLIVLWLAWRHQRNRRIVKNS